MSAPSLWAAVRDARPRLAAHARVYRRDVRGEPWAVVQNEIGGEQVRLNAAALDIVAAFDGHRRVDEVLAEQAPDADEAFREAFASCLVTLESSGLLRLGRVADTERLVARAEARARRRALDPLAWRRPLLDPDRALAWLSDRLRPLVGRPAALALATLFAVALATAAATAPDIVAELERVARSPVGWWRYALLYPALKLVHELAHALVVKHHGGAVHEAGVTLLVLMPVPYVDASDSVRFERRGQRLAVAAAGIVAEGAIACLGLLLWTVTEPGLVHEIAFAAALLGSISTLLFNANPLLRFDGYHLLQDLLDMPNLGGRASATLGWLSRRHALGAAVGRSPVTGPRELPWLVTYALASLLYRWVLTVAIALYLASTVPLAGVALALFALHRLCLGPLLRGLRYVVRSPELDGVRGAATARAFGGALALAAVVSLLPLPSSTRVEGVVGVPTQGTLYAGVDGEIAEAIAAPGAQLQPGENVLRLAAPALEARRHVLEAEIGVLLARRQATLTRDPVASEALATDLAVHRAELAALTGEIDALEVRAARAGRFAPLGGRLAAGRAVTRGDVLGHVVGADGLRVEAVVEQRAIGRVRAGVREARVRLAERVGEPVTARFVGVTPAGDRRLPSTALAWDGSRGIAVASNGDEIRTLEPVFHVELDLPTDVRASGIGGRAYVTLVHAPESLGARWWRAARQLFLEHLTV